ncbi:hypothetical protein [Phenylobacterium conjunctum]|uniref:Uncharacterized protein n=1 Tax=Phenylobacterium conjunctum TaxID=1298959 RepID=A0ABW3T1U1_9CAUL
MAPQVQRQANPFQRAAPPPAHFINERDFAAIYAAAEFASKFNLVLDGHVTILWDRLADARASSPQAELTAFLKCLRAWYAHWGISPAWIYSHETGHKVGPHTHFAIAVPVMDSPWALPYRSKFKVWASRYCMHRTGRKVPGALRVRLPNKPTPWLHWLNTHYLLKGYDPAAIVQAAELAPDRRAVRLGDLIAFPWRDPGPRMFRNRVGVSHALGPGQRKVGIPAGLYDPANYASVVDPFGLTSVLRPQPPFLSRYDQGLRDVRMLYPVDFLDRVRPPLTAINAPADLDFADMTAGLDV